MTEKIKYSRSPIWHYFEPIDPKHTKCLLCECSYRNSGNTTNLIDHLRRKHRDEYYQVVELVRTNANIKGNTTLAVDIPALSTADDNELETTNDTKDEPLSEIITENDINETVTTEESTTIVTNDNDVSMEHQDDVHDTNNNNDNNVENDENKNDAEVDNVQVVRVVPLPHARSEVWTYFGFVANDDGQIVDRTKVVCKICASTFCYSGNTTNFYSHLKSMHSEVQIRNNSSKSPAIRQFKRTFTNFMDESNGDNSSDNIGGTNANDYQYNQPNNNTNSMNQTIATLEDEPLPSRSLDSVIFVDDITQCLIDFLIADCRPLCVLQGKGFQRLLRLLAPGYVMPDKQKLSNELRKRYDELRRTGYEPSTMEKFDDLT